jgi:uncharacterized membrane protein YhhN
LNFDTLYSAGATAPIVLSLVAVTALVISDLCDIKPGRYISKPLAALAFLWLALQLNALDSSYGSWMFAGLFLCMLGDLCLMGENDKWFLAGLIAFLCGHLVYAATFVQLAVNIPWLVASTIPALLLVFFVLRWLLPHVEADMKIPVSIYTIVISAMLVCAGGTAGTSAAFLIVIGAWGFAMSDIAVARQQFVHKSKLNRIWGTPLYFLSQMILATSVGA